jgi:hypothetical protein
VGRAVQNRRAREGSRKLQWRNLTEALRQWFRSKQALVWVEIDTLPTELAPGRLYVLGEGTHVRALAMRCPCGCGESIHMNLLHGTGPCWQVTRHSDGAVSLHPAIRRSNGCRSHFFVRRSLVHWWNIETVGPRTSDDTVAGFLQRSARLPRQSSLSSTTSHSHQTPA